VKADEAAAPTVSQAAPESLFLATKIAIPKAQRRWIARPRLIERLGVPPASRVTLLHAGPGFGKTACLVQWQKELVLAGFRVAWYTAESEESDPAHFIGYLAAAVNQADGAIGGDVMELARAGSARRPALLITRIVNQIAASPDRYVFIIDDYHFVRSQAVDDMMSHLIAHAPPNLDIVISARGLPNLRLAKLRAEGSVAELGSEVLGLTRDETAGFIRGALATDLPPRDISQLQTLSEGWPAALQMMLVALGAKKHLHALIRAFTGEARLLRDYLTQEAFDGLPAATQEFLIRSSVLGRFCPKLVEHVTGITDGAAAIAEVERRQLLLQPLDQEGQWFRYHPLFAEFLLGQLQQREPGLEKVLHRSASVWFEMRHLWPEAVRHAMLSGDQARAIDIVDRCAMLLIEHGEYVTLLGWLAQLPAEALRQRPRILAAQAWALGLTLHRTEATALIPEVLRRGGEAATAGRDLDAEMSLLAAGAAMLDDDFTDMSFVEAWAPKVVAATPWVRDAYKTLASYTLTMRGEYGRARDFPPCKTALKIAYQKFLLGLAWWREGEGAEAEHTWTEAIEFADEEFGAHSVAAALARAFGARLFYEQGEWQYAQDALDMRLDVLDQAAPLEFLWSAYSTLAWSYVAAGKRDEARRVLDRGRLLARERRWARLEAAMIVDWLRLTDRRDLETDTALVSRLAEIAAAADRNTCAGRETAFLAEVGSGYLHGLTHVGSSGTRQVERAIEALGPKGAALLRAQSLMMLAEVREDVGEHDAARAAAAAALAIGDRLRLRQTYRDARREFRVLIGMADPESGAVSAVGAGTFREPPGTAQGGHAESPSASDLGAIRSLTEREREILILVARGMSNKEIGRGLRIGPETVKWHLKNLFSKLSVPNRIQAANRAKRGALLG
jgi:LuxR family maltose regulon positive regulatory protein